MKILITKQRTNRSFQQIRLMVILKTALGQWQDFIFFKLQGLGFMKQEKNPNPNILRSLYEEKLIESNMFSLYLSKGKGSSLIFGGIDMSFAQNPLERIKWANIISPDSYKIGIEGIGFQDTIFRVKKAVIDSGTSCITFPKRIAKEMIGFLQVHSGLKCKLKIETSSPEYSLMHCEGKQEQIKKLPHLVVQIDSQSKLHIPSDEYLSSIFISWLIGRMQRQRLKPSKMCAQARKQSKTRLCNSR